jgi:26S proteasome regulatory subunit N1
VATGLGIAYTASQRQELNDLLTPIVVDSTLMIDQSAIAALALGQVFAGSADGEIASSILQTMMERDEAQFKDPTARFMALGLALLYIGRQEDAEAVLETLKVIEFPIARQAEVLVEMCAYAGTGNVLKIQKMLHLCNDHLDADKHDDLFQTFAVIAIAVIAMGEDIGSDMALRAFNHLMHYGEKSVRKAVPLALGILCASHPVVSVLETLSKYSHDNELEVALSAIFAMGLVGAGTNNARLAQMLRQLAVYYHRDANCLFVVRLAQGLSHMAKGTVTVNPFHSNRQIMSVAAVSALLSTTLLFTDAQKCTYYVQH